LAFNKKAQTHTQRETKIVEAREIHCGEMMEEEAKGTNGTIKGEEKQQFSNELGVLFKQRQRAQEMIMGRAFKYRCTPPGLMTDGGKNHKQLLLWLSLSLFWVSADQMI
jgi:hypothetical protein